MDWYWVQDWATEHWFLSFLLVWAFINGLGKIFGKRPTIVHQIRQTPSQSDSESDSDEPQQLPQESQPRDFSRINALLAEIRQKMATKPKSDESDEAPTSWERMKDDDD